MPRLALGPVLLLGFALSATAGEVAVGDRTFRVPDGFTVERVAGPPLVDRPIVADFDELGRLYVADSSGSNDAPAKQLANPSHRIVRLEDTDGDGIYDRSLVFADKMMFPEGAMYREGSLYVAAPPSIWKLTDTDGDGKADLREEWYQGKTLTGCANDLHGPYDGPDGLIYWTKGAFAEQTIERPGKPPFTTRAAMILRARPDGTGVEPVMTGGMDNPVEVAFTPGGERIFTTTFLQHPAGGKRDGLVHAVYGAVYGKDHDAIDGLIRTGPDLMPPMTHLGPAAPSGLMRYESKAFGDGYKDNLFAALFNLHKVTRHVLEPAGATFTTTDSDFLSAADSLDFHPTDVLEDADGSLIVLDTGGWYKLCCPTSQIGKPDVLGAIYRVRRVGAPKVDDPRGLRISWAKSTPDELAKLLDDPRPAVRKRAVAALRRVGEPARMALARVFDRGEARSAEARRNAVWALSSPDPVSLRRLVPAALLDEDETVRQAALHVLSARNLLPGEHIDAMLSPTFGGTAQNVRAAAEACGRAGGVVPSALMDALERFPDDRAVEHSILYALIESPDRAGLRAEFRSNRPERRRSAMIALDQLGEAVPAPILLAALDAGGPEAEAAAWILERRDAYGPALAEQLRKAFVAGGAAGDALATLEARLARFARSEAIQGLMGERLADPGTAPKVREAILRAMARSGLKALPTPWAGGLAAGLGSGDPAIVAEAVGAAKALPGGDEALAVALGTVAAMEALPPAVRLDALAALPGGPGAIDAALFGFLRDQAGPDRPVANRLAAADALAKARLTPEQLAETADLLSAAGPLEADRLLAAFANVGDAPIGRRLVAALKESPALTSLRAEALEPRLASFPEPVRREAEALYAAIGRANADQKATLDALLAGLPAGDERRGQAVFHGAKASCLSCHAIGYLGGTVGPDLSRVGAIRDDRDLLEAVVFPSASFVRSYEPVVVATTSGQVHSGILRRDSPEEVVLAVAADKEVRIPRAEVEEMTPGTVSVMPAGLDKQLDRQELADLLAFLRSRR